MKAPTPVHRNNRKVGRRSIGLSAGLILTFLSSCGRWAYETLSSSGGDNDAASSITPSSRGPTDASSVDSTALGSVTPTQPSHAPESETRSTDVDPAPLAGETLAATDGASTPDATNGASSDSTRVTADVVVGTSGSSASDDAPWTATRETWPSGTETNVLSTADADSVSAEPPFTSGSDASADATSEVADASTSASATTSSVTDASAADATDTEDAAPCETHGVFATPRVVTGLPTPAFSPSLSADRLTLYFASNGDLYSAVRADVTSTEFGSVTAVAAVNSVANEVTPHLSRDGLRLYFARGDDPLRDLYVASRATTADAFGAPAALSSVNSPSYNDQLPRESPNGLELYFTSFRGATLFDVWVSRRNSVADAFPAPSVVTELVTAADESPGGSSRDGLTLLLASKRTGTLGGQDLWAATRPDLGAAYAGVTNLAALNTSFNEFDATLSADDLELMFSSDRSGSTLIYSALRECAP